jgi:AraC-like DNA-binding protein
MMSPIETAMNNQRKKIIITLGAVFTGLWLCLVGYFLTGGGKESAPVKPGIVVVHAPSPTAGVPAQAVKAPGRTSARAGHGTPGGVSWSYLTEVPKAAMGSTSVRLHETAKATVHSIGGGGGNGAGMTAASGSAKTHPVTVYTTISGGNMLALASTTTLAAPGATAANEIAETTLSAPAAMPERGIRRTNGDPFEPFLDPVGDITWLLILLLAVMYGGVIRKRKKLFTLLVLVWGVTAAMAAEPKRGEPIDTLLQRFDQKPGLKTAREFFAYMDKEEFMDEPVVFTAATPLDTMKALVWYWAGEWYYAEQEYALAEKNLLRALELMEYADEKSISDNLAMLGLAYMRQSKYDEALRYMHRCYQLDSKSGDPDRISSSLNTIAGTLLAAGNPEEAEGYILRAITYAKQADNPSRMAVIYGMTSEIENRLEHSEKALLYADSACMVEATTGNRYKMAVRQTQKASILVGLKRYNEAERILAEVIPYFREIGDQLSLAIALNKRGLTARGTGHTKEAVEYLNEAIAICQRIGNPYNEAYARRAIYEIMYKSNPEAAHVHLERYHQIKDSLYSHATSEQLARFNAEFGRDELEKEKAWLARRNNRLVWIGVVTAVVALFVIVFALVWLRRRQAKINEQLSTMMAELNEARNTSETVHETPPAEEQHEEQHEEYLTNEDKQFLKKLILAVTEMMNYKVVTVTQIADKMCVSPKTLNRRVQYLTGEGAKRYIMRIQLEQAKIMLIQYLDIPVVEIGNRCGFEDHSSFTRNFTQYVGMSPSDYRLTRGKG